jgi:hypothetical protein
VGYLFKLILVSEGVHPQLVFRCFVLKEAI